MIAAVDEFILYDEMQYTKRDWRNRNLIKTKNGLQWLTIPVAIKGKYFQKIKDVKIADKSWAKKHWTSIIHNYNKAQYFDEYRGIFEHLYASCSKEDYLSQINFIFLTAISSILKIKTKISWDMDYSLVDGKTERLLGLCKSTNATHYISGPSAKEYIDKNLFEKEGIDITFTDYSNYKPYTQLFGEFIHTVTVIDLIFNEGPNATKFMKNFTEKER